jgi:hypothetical protein
MSVEPRWNDIGRGKTEELGEKSVLLSLCPPKIQDANPSLRSERVATNHLSYGTTITFTGRQTEWYKESENSEVTAEAYCHTWTWM